MNATLIPDYRMIPSESAGCDGCDFRYDRNIRCSLIDCRPKHGTPVIAKITDPSYAIAIKPS